MSLTNKALWVIERNLRESLTLGEIATACEVSRFHLAHAFAASTGLPVMQYVRGRRLTEAASSLAAGARDILDLALETGYGSHEAFSRAFRAQFGSTPEMVRRNGDLEALPMVKAIKVPEGAGVELGAPRFAPGLPMLLVGLAERHSLKNTQGIAAQWRNFMARWDEIPNKAASIPLGVTTNMDAEGSFEYVCAAEVQRFSKLPAGLTQLRVPAQNYVVFTHRGHVSAIGDTYAAIWDRWFPSQNRQPAEGPSLERHLEGFDPRTGLGGVEIWIPVSDAG